MIVAAVTTAYASFLASSGSIEGALIPIWDSVIEGQTIADVSQWFSSEADALEALAKGQVDAVIGMLSLVEYSSTNATFLRPYGSSSIAMLYIGNLDVNSATIKILSWLFTDVTLRLLLLVMLLVAFMAHGAWAFEIFATTFSSTRGSTEEEVEAEREGKAEVSLFSAKYPQGVKDAVWWSMFQMSGKSLPSSRHGTLRCCEVSLKALGVVSAAIVTSLITVSLGTISANRTPSDVFSKGPGTTIAVVNGSYAHAYIVEHLPDQEANRPTLKLLETEMDVLKEPVGKDSFMILESTTAQAFKSSHDDVRERLKWTVTDIQESERPLSFAINPSVLDENMMNVKIVRPGSFAREAWMKFEEGAGGTRTSGILGEETSDTEAANALNWISVMLWIVGGLFGTECLLIGIAVRLTKTKILNRLGNGEGIGLAVGPETIKSTWLSLKNSNTDPIL